MDVWEHKNKLHKKSHPTGCQRDELEGGKWQRYRDPEEWTADMLIYVDGSAANERTMDREYGWAPRGGTSNWQSDFTPKYSLVYFSRLHN